jgi:hypothetical protein
LSVVCLVAAEAVRHTCLSVVDASNVVHAASDEIDAVRGPSQIIYFRSRRATHGLDSPCLLVFQSIFSEVCGMEGCVFGGHPEQNVSVVSSRREHFTWSIVRLGLDEEGTRQTHTFGTPSYYVDGLGVFGERRQVCHASVFSASVDFPELPTVSSVPG